MPFAHLHTHTQYSILNGTCKTEELLEKAEEYNMPALGITDTCNLYGAINFYKTAKKSSCKAIYGAEIWMWPDGLDSLQDHKTKAKKAPADGGWHLAFLIENKVGYTNLSALITKAIFDGMHYRPRIDFALLEKHSEGLIALTSGLNGPIGSSLFERHPEEIARQNIERLANIFGEDRLFLELQDFAIPEQEQMNDLARKIGIDFGLKTVVTNDVRHINPQEAVTLDLLNCVAYNLNVDDPDRLSLQTDQQYFKTEEEMRELFPDDIEAIERTVEIAERCEFQFKMAPPYFFPATTPPDEDAPIPEEYEKRETRMDIRECWADTQRNWEYFYKAFPPPVSFNLPDPKISIPPKPEGVGNICSYFEWYCEEGLKVRLNKYDRINHDYRGKTKEDYWKRLKFETDIIEHMGFPAYMLIVAEFINWSKDNDIPVGPGRGSAAGSIVAWAMGITDIDPLLYDLLFERFLNPERVSMPDIDVDFCQDRREDAIKHVRDKYGSELVSQIITYGKMAARAAIKDIARALGVEFQASNELAGFVPEKPGTKLQEALDLPIVQNYMETNPLAKRVFSLAKSVENMTRQTGIHAAGVVIADKPLEVYAPLYRDGDDGGPVVQYDMKSAESIGLIKFDFLGLKTLDQIRDALKFIKYNHGEDIDIGIIPLDDLKAYKLLQAGDTVGVFQLESEGMQGLLKRMAPENIEDVIASIALYRPGPLQSGMDGTFVDCKKDPSLIEYKHPKLEKVLSNTYGSIVYQEQVMQIAQELSGYSLGEADLLRRAMGKKDVDEMDRQKKRFVQGFLPYEGFPREKEKETAAEIFDLMAYFAGYGFNKSHSAAYGMISYQTGWLKAQYKPEYMAALMSIECGNSDKVNVFIKDCKNPKKDRDRGYEPDKIKILVPDINKSYWEFYVPKGTTDIRFGFGAIKGAGKNAIESIIKSRKKTKKGEFKDFMDFLEAIDFSKVNKKVLENLIKCGAFDWTGHSRKSLFESLPSGIKVAQKAQEQKNSGQLSLFGSSFAKPTLEIPDLGEWPLRTKMKFEKEALGFYITDHPINSYQDIIDTCNTSSTDFVINHLSVDHEFSIAGIIVSANTMLTKTGKEMVLVDIEDADNVLTCAFFGEAFQKNQENFQKGLAVLLTGKKEWNKNRQMDSFKGEKIVALSDLQKTQTRRVIIRLDLAKLDAQFLNDLETIFIQNRGNCPIEIMFRYKDTATISLEIESQITPNDNFTLAMETLLGSAEALELR